MNREVIYSGEHPLYPDTWEVHTQSEDGRKWLVHVPKSALDWRSAEYGVDPNDVDSLMDIILHEPHMPTQLEEARDPELKAKAVPRLLEADNTTDALRYHMQRVQSAPIQIKVRGNSALDPIRQGHKPNHDLITRAKQSVDINRWIAKFGDLPTPRESIAELKAIPFVETGMKDPGLDPQTDSISSTTLTLGIGG